VALSAAGVQRCAIASATNLPAQLHRLHQGQRAPKHRLDREGRTYVIGCQQAVVLSGPLMRQTSEQPHSSSGGHVTDTAGRQH